MGETKIISSKASQENETKKKGVDKQEKTTEAKNPDIEKEAEKKRQEEAKFPESERIVISK